MPTVQTNLISGEGKACFFFCSSVECRCGVAFTGALSVYAHSGTAVCISRPEPLKQQCSCKLVNSLVIQSAGEPEPIFVCFQLRGFSSERLEMACICADDACCHSRLQTQLGGELQAFVSSDPAAVRCVCLWVCVRFCICHCFGMFRWHE